MNGLSVWTWVRGSGGNLVLKIPFPNPLYFPQIPHRVPPEPSVTTVLASQIDRHRGRQDGSGAYNFLQSIAGTTPYYACLRAHSLPIRAFQGRPSYPSPRVATRARAGA